MDQKQSDRLLTIFRIMHIPIMAYLKDAVSLNSINGFTKTRVYPFNPYIVTDMDYTAAATTEMEDDEKVVEPILFELLKHRGHMFRQQKPCTYVLPHCVLENLFSEN